jgi:hypothetical protein
MPVTREKLITWQTWTEFLAQTTSNESFPLVELAVPENSALMVHLFIVVKTLDGANAAYYDAEALFRRETGQDVVLVSSPSGNQTSDGDFTPQNPDVSFAVDTGNQTAQLIIEGIEDLPLVWIANVLPTRRF